VSIGFLKNPQKDIAAGKKDINSLSEGGDLERPEAAGRERKTGEQPRHVRRQVAQGGKGGNDRVIRVALNEFHRKIKQRQFAVFIHQLCRPSALPGWMRHFSPESSRYNDCHRMSIVYGMKKRTI
jgi:hypothetical protein